MEGQFSRFVLAGRISGSVSECWAKEPTHVDANRSRRASSSCSIVKSSPGRVFVIDVVVGGEAMLEGVEGNQIQRPGHGHDSLQTAVSLLLGHSRTGPSPHGRSLLEMSHGST